MGLPGRKAGDLKIIVREVNVKVLIKENGNMVEKKFNWHLLKTLREKKGLTQEKFMIELSSIGFERTRNTLRKWENGITAPDANDLAVISSFFGIPIQSFYK